MTRAAGRHTLVNRSGWLPRLVMVLLGAIGALGFAPHHLWPFTLLSLAALYVRVMAVADWDRPGRSAFGTGLLYGLGWFSAGCFWITAAFVERGEAFLLLIPPLVGGLAVLLSLFWGVAMGVCARIVAGLSVRQRVWAGPVLFTACFTLAELARGHVASGFPWNLPGYIFAPGGGPSQLAWIVGIYGLTMVVLGMAGATGEALRTRNWKLGAVAAVLLVGLFGYGTLRLSATPPPERQSIQPGVALRLVVVPFRQSDKFDPVRSAAVVDAHILQSVQPGIEDITHVVWPEGTVNGLAIENMALLGAMGRQLAFADDTPPVWLMNSLRQEITPDPKTGTPEPRYYNSAVAVTFDALGNPAVAAFDDKRKLVPFGEFIPGGEVVEALGARLVSTALGSITGAKEKRVARFPGLPPLSAQVCYEVIFPGLTPRGDGGQDAGPEFILNQSNDAWFGPGVGPKQHAAIARYRAIEEGLPLVRSAANGVSGVFDAYGRAIVKTDGQRVSHIDTTLPKPLKRKTSLGLVNFSIALLNLVLILLVGAIGRRRSRAATTGA